MLQQRMFKICMGVMLAATGLVFAGSGQILADSGSETFACVSKAKLDQTIAPQAQLEDFSCSLQKWKGEKVLHFHVRIKNVSEKPQRFRVNIFLDNGKAVGGLIPRKTKKGLVKPGASASFVYPVRGMTGKPKAVTLLIKTMGQ